MDLESLSLAELTDLQNKVGRAIITYKDRMKREALAELEQRATALGFSPTELVGIGSQKRRRPARGKFVNPANPEETWSGRGRRPRWIEAALQDGKSLDDFKI